MLKDNLDVLQYNDSTCQTNILYSYIVRTVSLTGDIESNNSDTVQAQLVKSDVQDILVNGNIINNVYPQPANETIHIEYYLPVADYISLKVIDIFGKTVDTGFDSKYFDAGWHNEIIETEKYSSGIYFVILKTNYLQSTMKIIVSN